MLAHLSVVTLIGYAAALTVFATFCMSTMLPLRIVALVSNVLFGLYGYFGALYPVLILHACLFPVNIWRLAQVFRVVSVSSKAKEGSFDIMLLRRHMRERRLAAGETLFRIGDHADAMFYVRSGELLVEELDAQLRPGDVVGEMGILAHNRKRTATVVAMTDCVLLALTGAKARELFFQYPAFTIRLMGVLTSRLIDDVRAETLAHLHAATAGRTPPGP